MYDECVSGAGDDSRTGTSGMGKPTTTQEVSSQERFGANPVDESDDIGKYSTQVS